MLHQRGAGVLMHISSLPSPYGIGVFDRHARDFIDRIADMGFTYWQVLPFNPIDGAGSPYCSPSAFAGNYLFIDPQGLQDMGLATAEEVAANHYDGTPTTTPCWAGCGRPVKQSAALPWTMPALPATTGATAATKAPPAAKL